MKKSKGRIGQCFDCRKYLDQHEVNFCGECVDKIAKTRDEYYLKLGRVEELIENARDRGYDFKFEGRYYLERVLKIIKGGK